MMHIVCNQKARYVAPNYCTLNVHKVSAMNTHICTMSCTLMLQKIFLCGEGKKHDVVQSECAT